ncbi:sugar-binding protein [Actinocatenispora thailandica]|uniref:Sugar-binding protein n=1 Tax=Actinocatenispora thailandica TaxID=227318 RepID=A0A7R7DQL2_9ACTN|nr:extracellular solute-binding protein [Actinocatenispora thailandica]BCJ35855.1 sugar-binding protein [Actinocatenispora thailandica]
MNSQFRRALAVALAACAGAAGLAGCGSSDNGSSNGKVTISVDCQPPKSNKTDRDAWNADVAAFQKLHPNITIKSVDKFPCEEPASFTAQLRGGTEADVFYAYATDTEQVLDSGQVADITPYVTDKTVPGLSDLDKTTLNVGRRNGKLYSLPRTNYAMGLVINRKLFKQAGLDPDQPPTTWAEVAKDAKQITEKVGHGVAGYADYSAGNNGGWHFTAEMYAQGGQVVTADGKKADFNNANGRAILTRLHEMRYTDDSMGAKQNLAWADLLKLASAGKVGMYVGAPDTIKAIHENFKGDYADFGMGPMPGETGPAPATLGGGDQYFFKKTDTPAQIRAGIAWLAYEELTPGKGQFDYARGKRIGQTVGQPEPQLFTGDTEAKIEKLRADNATVPVDNYASFREHPVPFKVEPPNAQAIYKVLDTAMSAVLTNRNADVGKLLATAEQQVNQVLAATG